MSDKGIDEDIEVHLLFEALIRPPMTMGVTLDYFALNLMLSVIVFIGAGSLLYLLTFIPIHLVGCAVFRYDKDLFSIVFKKFAHIPNQPNKKLWGVSSYEPY